MPTTRNSSNMTTMQDNSEQENLFTTMEPVIGDTFSFFELPPELRNRIYSYCTGTVKISKKYSCLSDTQKAGQVTHQAWPQLKLVSKDLKQEYEAQMVLERRQSTLIVLHDPDDATVRWNIPLPSPRSSCHLSSGYLDMLCTITRLELSFHMELWRVDAQPLLQSLPRLKHVKLNMYCHPYDLDQHNNELDHYTADFVNEKIHRAVGDSFGVIPPEYEIDCVVTYTLLRAIPANMAPPYVDFEQEAWEDLMIYSPLNRMQVRGTLSNSPNAIHGMELEFLNSTEEEAAFETLQGTYDDILKHYEAGRLTESQILEAIHDGSLEDILREAEYQRTLECGTSVFGGISPADLWWVS